MRGIKGEALRYLLGAFVALFVDIAIVQVFVAQGAHPWIARIPGLLAGVTITYFFNRRFTFDTDGAPSLRQWGAYLLQQSVGTGINLGVSVALLSFLNASPLRVAFSILIGAAVGFCYNFFAARRLLHRPSKES